jgi:hypothetical protein
MNGEGRPVRDGQTPNNRNALTSVAGPRDTANAFRSAGGRPGLTHANVWRGTATPHVGEAGAVGHTPPTPKPGTHAAWDPTTSARRTHPGRAFTTARAEDGHSRRARPASVRATHNDPRHAHERASRGRALTPRATHQRPRSPHTAPTPARLTHRANAHTSHTPTTRPRATHANATLTPAFRSLANHTSVHKSTLRANAM